MKKMRVLSVAMSALLLVGCGAREQQPSQAESSAPAVESSGVMTLEELQAKNALEEVLKQGAVKIDQGYIGSCTNGRAEDIEIVAKILKGKQIAPGVRLMIVPASREVLRWCMDKGYIQDLIDAGATLVSPGCAACLGTHEGVLAPGEVCITCTNRNFPGRMGSNKASIYLGSPATVAASVLTGVITDPTPYI